MTVGPSGQCLEICGKGVNMGQAECDDGNREGGDGCSGGCQVEKGWTCRGTRYGSDACYLNGLTVLNVKINLA